MSYRDNKEQEEAEKQQKVTQHSDQELAEAPPKPGAGQPPFVAVAAQPAAAAHAAPPVAPTTTFSSGYPLPNTTTASTSGVDLQPATTPSFYSATTAYPVRVSDLEQQQQPQASSPYDVTPAAARPSNVVGVEVPLEPNIRSASGSQELLDTFSAVIAPTFAVVAVGMFVAAALVLFVIRTSVWHDDEPGFYLFPIVIIIVGLLFALLSSRVALRIDRHRKVITYEMQSIIYFCCIREDADVPFSGIQSVTFLQSAMTMNNVRQVWIMLNCIDSDGLQRQLKLELVDDFKGEKTCEAWRTYFNRIGVPMV